MRYPKTLIAAFLISLFFTTTDFAQGFQMGGNRNDGNHQFDNMRNLWNDGMDNMHQRQEERRDRWQDGWNNMRERQQNRRDHMRDNWNDMRNRGSQHRGSHH